MRSATRSHPGPGSHPRPVGGEYEFATNINSFVDPAFPIAPLIVLLFGAFTFAFLLGEMVHEIGHYLAHMALGSSGMRIILDPFGGSHIAHAPGGSAAKLGATSLAGPLANLLLANLIFLVLRDQRDSRLPPLVLWGPVALLLLQLTL